MSTTHAMRTGRRIFGALCAAGLLATAPALANEMDGGMADVEAAPTASMTAMADPAASGDHAPAAKPAPETGEAMAAPPAPAFGAAIEKALNAYYRGDYAGAADMLNAAAAKDPADPAAPYFLGYTYYRMGQFAKSRAAFAQAYQVDPHFSPEPPASK